MDETLPPRLHYTDEFIRETLKLVHTIAMVGASNNTSRPSFLVLKYLMGRGYRVFAINPGLAGGTIAGAPVYARLSDVPEPVDMVDIFRNSAAAGDVVDEALQLVPLPKVIWMQLSVRHDAAAARAQAQGVRVIMDRCPKIEFGRLSGESGWNGLNSRILSSRKPIMAKGSVQKRRL
ncbi:MAG: CoA-binding protein [Hyphomicrobiales bacterium]|nr:CoA-binding protein [Hyphomicrobiales bacterium]MDE2114040.1 CoA-binding protein [Hyphomicrobiales bacterium]